MPLETGGNQSQPLLLRQILHGSSLGNSIYINSVPNNSLYRIANSVLYKLSRDLFVAQWIPEAGKTQLYRSFMDLKQGNMTFSEYERNSVSNQSLGQD